MKKYIFILVAVLATHGVFAQDEVKEEPKEIKEAPTRDDAKPKRLFHGMIIAGLNATQVDGDKQGGFNKAGANAGVGLLVNLPKNFAISLELLYSMKGARGSNDDWKVNQYHRSIDLDYIDLPICINYYLKMKKTPKWSAMLSAGLIPGVLVRQHDEILEPTPYGVQGFPYNKFCLDSRLGVTGIFMDHYAVGFSWEYSVIPINALPFSTGSKFVYIQDGQMRHQIISIRAIYIL